ncbi:MAG: NAD(P)H-dependent oxidoreductase [Ignavibacteria bacterium]
MKKIKIVCLGGSMEDNSSTLALLKYTASKLEKLGAETYLADIKKINLPIFCYKALKNLRNTKFKLLAERIKEADGLIFASPEYHGTVSSAFKNAIDFLEILSSNKPPYLSFKPVGCIALGGAEYAGFSTLDAMVHIIHNLRGIAAPSSIAIGYGNSLFNKKGELVNEVVKKRIDRLAGEVYTLALRLRD